MDSLTKLNLDDYKPLRDVVFENLRSAILEGKLKSGQRLMEVQLAEQLGVSRTPVREAIRKLELEGLVVMLPRKGAYVANISVKDLMDVLEIRASLEGLGVSLAAERRDDEDIKKLEEIEIEFEEAVKTQNIEMLLKKDIEFHECIFKSANNKKLAKMINSLWEQVQRFRITYVSDLNASLSLIDEHQAILGAIREANVLEAKNFAIEHIEKAEQFMLEHCTK